jgi:hypothetical protein
MEQPGATGDWSFKDVVAHISAWRSHAIEQLTAVRRGQTASSQFWPMGWDEERDLEKINQWIYEENRDRTLQDVLNESRQQYRHLRELMRALPEEELLTPNRYAWMEGGSLADLAEFGHLHEEHEPVLRQWLASLEAKR